MRVLRSVHGSRTEQGQRRLSALSAAVVKSHLQLFARYGSNGSRCDSEQNQTMTMCIKLNT